MESVTKNPWKPNQGAAWLQLMILSGVFAVSAATASQPSSWPTLHGDPQRSGFHPSFPRGPLKLTWRKELWRELTGPRAEVIGDASLVFMGTYAGNLYAWDAVTGVERWVVRTKGPLGHSPSLAEGKLYFGSMDRNLYALEAATGREAWRYECGEGIWTSPVVHRGLVMFGDRAGTFHAVRANDGSPAWRFQTGHQILTSASISEDGNRVIFASEDMHVYCLNAGDGALRWKSRKLQGLSVRDYFPVIAGGLVFITTNPVKDFHTILTQHEQMLVRRTGYQGKDSRFIPGNAADVEQEQAMIVDFLRLNPAEQTFYTFNVADGREPWIAPILYTGGLHNSPTPPCVNPQTGDVFVQLRSAYGVWDGGGEVRSFTCFGRLDLKTGRVELIAHGYPSKSPDRPPGATDMPWMTFNYIGDETQTLSCTPGWLQCTHQGFLGALNLETGLTERLHGKRDTYAGFYGPGNFGWENQGGIQRAQAAGEPFGLVNEWHGPARAMVSVIGNRVYFPAGSQVLCLEEAR